MSRNINNQGNTTWIWVVYFVGFDDSTDPEISTSDIEPHAIDPHVGYERIETTDDANQQHDDSMLAALLRGGQLLAIVEDDDEAQAAAVAAALEKEILRTR